MSGLAVFFYSPAFDLATPVYAPYSVPVPDLSSVALSGLSFEQHANGGMISASITLALDSVDSQRLFEHALGWHVVVKNLAQAIVFEGWVNRITRGFGAIQGEHGPLQDVINRASVVYTPILDPTTNPITTGPQTVTTIADDADSQARYGIFEQVINGGQLLLYGATDEAAQLRDSTIISRRWPVMSENVTIGTSAVPTVTLDALGYSQRLRSWIVNDATQATVRYDTKIGIVIALDPMGITQTGTIDANASLASREEIENRTAWDVLDNLCQRGDATYQRYTWGIYADRRLDYRVQPARAAPAYIHEITAPTMKVLEASSLHPVDLWDVRPAQWMYLPDYPALDVGIPRDPRFWFIETVTFAWPNSLTINGVELSTLPQLLAQKGLA